MDRKGVSFLAPQAPSLSLNAARGIACDCYNVWWLNFIDIAYLATGKHSNDVLFFSYIWRDEMNVTYKLRTSFFHVCDSNQIKRRCVLCGILNGPTLIRRYGVEVLVSDKLDLN